MIAIIDYGVGNLFSLTSSLKYINEKAVVTRDPEVIKNADKIILPGVGAFEDAMKKFEQSGLRQIVDDEVKKGKSLLGICLGMQMLFEKSYEYGEHKGLGYIDGEVLPFAHYIDSAQYKIPHMGWNSLDIKYGDKILDGVEQGEYVYFVHSYFAKTNVKNVVATANYGVDVTAVVRKDNVWGTQFHPEKSGEIGLKMLSNFARGEL